MRRSSDQPSVVITGWGVISPSGCSPTDLWSALLTGKSVAEPLTGADLSQHKVRFGCPVRGLESVETGITAKDRRRMDPFALYGLTAALMAYQDAGFPEPEPSRGAVVLGSAVGGRHTSDRESLNFAEAGAERVNPLMPLMTMPNAAAARVSISLGWQGTATTIATTCSSGADAIGHAAILLQSGRADVVIAGGCEATLSPMTLAGFGNLGAVSTRNDEPERASRPFDADRDGFVMGEGAGCVVLERRTDASARGAEPYAEIAGYASTSDAHHLSKPEPEGRGAIQAMRGALFDSGMLPADIVHVNAHGTSTPLNDKVEAQALHSVFDTSPPVTAPKGVLGHLIGAAGAIELIAAVQAMNHQQVPPTANHERADPGLMIDVVHGTARSIPLGPALTNSFGFGGHNSSLVVTPA